MQSQMHNRPPGIPGFLDPATGRFTPGVGSAPKPAAAPDFGEFTFNTSWNFDSALKPWNTVFCYVTIYTYERQNDFYDTYTDTQVYQFGVGEPLKQLSALAPVGYSLDLATIQCVAADDSGANHKGGVQLEGKAVADVVINM
jgi:hypothetical protein